MEGLEAATSSSMEGSNAVLCFSHASNLQQYRGQGRRALGLWIAGTVFSAGAESF